MNSQQLKIEILEYLLEIDAVVREKDIMPNFRERVFDDNFKQIFRDTLEHLLNHRFIRMDGSGYFSLYPHTSSGTVDLNTVVIKIAIEPKGEEFLQKSEPAINISDSPGAFVGDNNQSSIIADKMITNPTTINTTPKKSNATKKISIGVAIIIIAWVIEIIVSKYFN